MKILFLSMVCIQSSKERGMYQDLVNEFVNKGHNVTVLSPSEKRKDYQEKIIKEDNCEYHVINVGNITDTPFIEKGISVVRIQNQIIKYVKSNFRNSYFDLFIVATPPVTFDTIVCYIKKTFKCKIYLLLKDFWPDSLLDINTPGGKVVKNIVYKYFRNHEVRLYSNCDAIGLMSQANLQYLLDNNQYLDPKIAHINPNSICPNEYKIMDCKHKNTIRIKYGVPIDKTVFIYGGTLGVGQNVPHIVECLKKCSNEDCHFVISGRGVQYHFLDEYVKEFHPNNVTLINGLPKDEYDNLLSACDIGLIFLRYSAKTPNFPSRLLSYTNLGKPVLCCTDKTTDIGIVVEQEKFGWACLADKAESFELAVKKALSSDLVFYGLNSRRYIENNATASKSYKIIIDSMNKRET